MNDDVSVLERISYTPNEALGPFGGRVDRDEAEGSFGGSHCVNKPNLFLFHVISDTNLFEAATAVPLNKLRKVDWFIRTAPPIPTLLSARSWGQVGCRN